jgi:hypothetical protein
MTNGRVHASFDAYLTIDTTYGGCRLSGFARLQPCNPRADQGSIVRSIRAT